MADNPDNISEIVDALEPNMFLTSDPELNKQRRRQVGPAYSLASLRKMEPTILATGVQQLLDKWNTAIEQSSDRPKVCYDNDFLMMTFDVIGSLGFGKTQRSLTAGDLTVVRWVKRSFDMMIMQMATDPESKIRMTPSQVTTEVILTFLAGADTNSSTLTWTIHLFMLHPQHYRRAVDEVRSSFDKDHLITFDEAKVKLSFLEACIYESMRIRPVMSSLPRVIPPGGVMLQGHFIPEGYTCLVAIPAANMNKDAWDKPHIFNPEWFIGNKENERNILTFSSGVRFCPGRNLAWIEILTTLANLFNAYNFELPDDALFTPDNLDKHGQPVIMPQKMVFTNGPRFPKRDCQIFISKRQK
ncbi:cytochrome P450 [Martensiomyces pterosporus]|nr:cytochrome P450 [Martensiomyces pterosporus]